MSQEDVNASSDNQSQDSNQGDDSSTETVSKKAYLEQQKDMFKFKQKGKDLELENNQLRADKKAQEDAQLESDNKYKELWESEKTGREAAEKNLEANNDLYIKAVKKSQLKSALGGKVKDEYLSFADIDSIQVNDDGTLVSESVQEVANKFRKDHPELVGSSENSNITDTAPGNEGPAETKVELGDQSEAQLRDLILNAPVGGKKFNM